MQAPARALNPPRRTSRLKTCRAPRRWLAVTVAATAVACLLAACGSSSGPAGEAPVTASASGADLTVAGYSALQGWVAINQQVVHLVEVHGVTLPAYRTLRADCRRLGPNSTDLEVQAFRSICAGAFDQAFALIRLAGCGRLATDQRRGCFMGVLNTTTTGTQKLLSADNSVLQILDHGACYSMLGRGMSMERTLLNTGNQLLSAEQAGTATVQAVNSWASAFTTIIRAQARAIAKLIKHPPSSSLSTGTASSSRQGAGGVCAPAGASGSAAASGAGPAQPDSSPAEGGSTPE